MTKIERIGLYLGIPASVIAISDWLSESIDLMPYIISSVKYLDFLFTKLFDIILDVVTFEIQLWMILLIVIAILVINEFKKKFFKVNENSLSSQYNKLEDNQQNIFNIIVAGNEKRMKCTYNIVLHNIKQKQLNISNLEAQEILESLIRLDLIELQTEWMDESHYLLTERGRSLAVVLIKSFK